MNSFMSTRNRTELFLPRRNANVVSISSRGQENWNGKIEGASLRVYIMP